MGILKYNNLTFIYGCKILPPVGYSAINLFGYVFTRKTYNSLVDYLNSSRGDSWCRHEAIHTIQADRFQPRFLRWVLYYIVYLYEFFKAWPLFMSWRQSYRTICFELEAYKNQGDPNYTTSQFEHYVYTNEVRKGMKV